MNEVTASADTLMRQAPATAGLYLSEAIDEIDNRLGDGYAAKHPELLAAFITVAAADFHTANLRVAIQDIVGMLGRAR